MFDSPQRGITPKPTKGGITSKPSKGGDNPQPPKGGFEFCLVAANRYQDPPPLYLLEWDSGV